MLDVAGPAPTQLWLPTNPDQLRSGFYFCNSLIQLMESVYLDLRLDAGARSPRQPRLDESVQAFCVVRHVPRHLGHLRLHLRSTVPDVLRFEPGSRYGRRATGVERPGCARAELSRARPGAGTWADLSRGGAQGLRAFVAAGGERPGRSSCARRGRLDFAFHIWLRRRFRQRT